MYVSRPVLFSALYRSFHRLLNLFIYQYFLGDSTPGAVFILVANIHTSNKSLASSPRYGSLLLVLPPFLILTSRFTLQHRILLTCSCRTTHQTSLTLGSNPFLKSRGSNNIKSSSNSDSRSEYIPPSNSGQRDLHIWRRVA